MKLTPSSLYLSLLLDTFESQMMPDLQSPKARGNAVFFVNTIRELLRRELHYPDALPSINSEGARIVAELAAALGTVAPAKAGGAGDADSKQIDPLDIFEHLTADIAELGERLSQLGENAPPSSHKLLRQAAEWECGAHNRLLGLGGTKSGNGNGGNIDPFSREAFQSYIQSVHPDGDKVQVTAYERVPGGFGNQTWAVTVQDAASVDHQWIIRKNDRALLSNQHKTFNLEREFHLVKAVSSGGFPAPRPLWLAKEAPGSDAPFYVMERLLGKPPGSFLGGAGKLPEALILECAELLAKVHSLPLESLRDFIRQYDYPEVLSETVEENFRRNLAEWRAYVKERDSLPSPTLVYLFDWLERNIPKDDSRPVLNHGDFGIHNMLVNEGHVSAVLDWETSGFCSPGLDLSYFKPEVEKHMDWQVFLRHYEACGGRAVDTATLNYCKAYQAMKISVPIFRCTKLLQDGDLTEIRHTAFELGLNPYFMNMALASTAPDNE